MLIASVRRTVARRFEQMSAIVTIKTRKKITAPTKVLNINNKVSSSVSPPIPSQKDFGPSSAWAGALETDFGKIEVLLSVDVMLRALFSGHGISTASCSIATAVSEALMFLEIVSASLGDFSVSQCLFTLAVVLISGAAVDLKMVTVVVRGAADVVVLKVVVVEAGFFGNVLVNSLDFNFKVSFFACRAGMVVGLADLVLTAEVIGGVVLEVPEVVMIKVLFFVEAGLGVVGATVDFVVVVDAFVETVVLVVVVLFTVVISLIVVFLVVIFVVVRAVVDSVVLGAHSAHPPQAIAHLHLVSQGLAAPGHQL